MNERLLQFIWQFQYFNKQQLFTTEGEPLTIIRPGNWNHHQGPDFSAATIRIGNTTWVGNIEIHILSSDWRRHKHSGDERYTNIILHVVWEDDMPVYDAGGNKVPSVVLHDLVPKHLLERYAQMMNNNSLLPCSSFLPVMEHLAWTAWKERLLIERLQRKAIQVLQLLAACQGHWEEVCWQMTAANFGIQVNASLFSAVAQTLPLSLLLKHSHSPLQVEALLFGQANLLTNPNKDAYPRALQKEYSFLKKKYSLRPVNTQPAFLRMRPAGFPTIRMAQVAALVYTHGAIFSQLKETKDTENLIDIFRVTASNYWNTHYIFDEPASEQVKQVGKAMAENIIINTVSPLLFAYSSHTKNDTLKHKVVQWLYQLPPEHNRITRNWQYPGITNRSALDSQALIELTNHYCIQKRCLDCSVGNKILKS